MPTILALETSTLRASVALLVDDTTYERESGVNDHSESLLRLVDECLAEAKLSLEDVEAVGIGAGPGSFTGLRIGMATAKGLCFALGMPLVAVSSLDTLARTRLASAQDGQCIAAVMDARRKEVFVALYQVRAGSLHRFGEERVMAPAEAADWLRSQDARPDLVCGDGYVMYRDAMGALGDFDDDARKTPGAADVAALVAEQGWQASDSDSLRSVAPSYVRLPEAQIKFPDGNTGGTFSSQ